MSIIVNKCVEFIAANLCVILFSNVLKAEMFAADNL